MVFWYVSRMGMCLLPGDPVDSVCAERSMQPPSVSEDVREFSAQTTHIHRADPGVSANSF